MVRLEVSCMSRLPEVYHMSRHDHSQRGGKGWTLGAKTFKMDARINMSHFCPESVTPVSSHAY